MMLFIIMLDLTITLLTPWKYQVNTWSKQFYLKNVHTEVNTLVLNKDFRVLWVCIGASLEVEKDCSFKTKKNKRAPPHKVEIREILSLLTNHF